MPIKTFFAEQNVDQALRERFFPDYNFHGTIVEVGGATPEFISMSRHFGLNGWKVIIVEPIPEFADMHRRIGNTVYEYACSNCDADNVPFTQVVMDEIKDDQASCHSFSSLDIKSEYKKLGYNPRNSKIIQVKTRTLDSIIKEAGLLSIDILSIDTEGWECEVISGLSCINPTIIVAENLFGNEKLRQIVVDKGYRMDCHMFGVDIFAKIG